MVTTHTTPTPRMNSHICGHEHVFRHLPIVPEHLAIGINKIIWLYSCETARTVCASG